MVSCALNRVYRLVLSLIEVLRQSNQRPAKSRVLRTKNIESQTRLGHV